MMLLTWPFAAFGLLCLAVRLISARWIFTGSLTSPQSHTVLMDPAVALPSYSLLSRYFFQCKLNRSFSKVGEGYK